MCLQPSSTDEWAWTDLFNIFTNPERISLLMDKSREDSPKHASRLYAHLQTCTGLVRSFLIKVNCGDICNVCGWKPVMWQYSHKTISAVLGCTAVEFVYQHFSQEKSQLKKWSYTPLSDKKVNSKYCETKISMIAKRRMSIELCFGFEDKSKDRIQIIRK